MFRRKHLFLAAADDGTTGAPAPSPTPAPTPSPAPSGTPTPAPAPSGDTLLGQGGGDWLPEKFRVAKDDGSLDVEASARKLAGSYTELEKARPAGTVPKAPEEYAPEGLPEGVNFEELKADPVYQSFLKGAHGKGMTNDQVSYVLNEYIKLVPDLIAADQSLSADEARTELGKVWKDDQSMQQGLGAASRAVQGFGAQGDVPGAVDRLMQKYGNDPDFLAFAAAVGKEMQEDVPIQAGTQQAQDWDAEVAKIKADPAYTDERHPQHKVMVDKLSALYQRRYGAKPQQLASTVVR